MDDFETAKQYFLAGLNYVKAGNYINAEIQFLQSLELIPDRVSTLTNLSAAQIKLKKLDDAKASVQRALSIDNEYVEAWLNLGLIERECKNNVQAIAHFDTALKLNPDYAEAWSNRGLALNDLKRYEEAIVDFDKAIALRSAYAEAWSNKGLALKNLNRFEAALADFEKAIQIMPAFVEAWSNSGLALHELKRYEEAILHFKTAIGLKPDFAFLFGRMIKEQMLICDWREFDLHVAILYEKLSESNKVTQPFPLLALIDDEYLQRKAAEIWAQEDCLTYTQVVSMPKMSRRTKIRIGYYSADFHNHATAYLMAELFELHNKDRFEIYAFSYGPDNHDEMRNRLRAAFDQFFDVEDKMDSEVAALSRELQIDIAIDLKGYTDYGRTSIFAYRAAPIQVNYLGYPGTLGTEYLDYIIADPIIIPESNQEYYTEKIVYLPNTYQVNDSRRKISDKQFKRTEVELPEGRFVYCCFNNNYKITPDVFDSWMRILKQVKDSVLWLLGDNDSVIKNLCKEAVARGVASERLIFAGRKTLPEHLARHRLADLFLDTLPYNAHTTTSDALWAGLPVLTCIGQSFAGRVSASLLTAIDLPELITYSQDEFESVAIDLATNPEKLAHIKQKLWANRLTTSLFDTALFTKHIEAAFSEMYERYQNDLPPAHIYVHN